jgi:hypothetical protein
LYNALHAEPFHPATLFIIYLPVVLKGYQP